MTDTTVYGVQRPEEALLRWGPLPKPWLVWVADAPARPVQDADHGEPCGDYSRGEADPDPGNGRPGGRALRSLQAGRGGQEQERPRAEPFKWMGGGGIAAVILSSSLIAILNGIAGGGGHGTHQGNVEHQGHLETLEGAERLAGHFVNQITSEQADPFWSQAAGDLLVSLFRAAYWEGGSVRDVMK
ncbi:hypothetical protein [Streptomyces sp. NPDC045251]|uniref:hypothetical protein n=1 Tax=unclassified Streptomyces TaxID=2593676 RepID=UPI0033D37EBD